MTDTKDAAAFLAKYAKQYHAGAFATPLANELRPSNLREWSGSGRTVAVTKTLDRPSRRTDFTGTKFELPANTPIITHLARTADAPLPDLADFGYVVAYPEDRALHHHLTVTEQRQVVASRVTAAAEVINSYGPPGQHDPTLGYAPHDQATVTPLPMRIPPSLRDKVLAEVQTVAQWDDDFPYYSDGSWSSVSLKGFWPRDPRRGVKPTEMPRSWKAEHPNDLARTCEWTVLAGELPALTQIVKNVPWWKRTERVRLLKMDAGGRLGRHTDITDRDSGTGDGQIVRFHVPLITDKAVRLHTWDVDGRKRSHHLPEYGCFYLDARKPHAVTNDSNVNRVHLVVDVLADPTVRGHLADGFTRYEEPRR